jgi:hypothetical protein
VYIIGSALFGFAVLAIFGFTGAAEAMGAHPFWALKVCLAGGFIGAVTGAVLSGLVVARRGGWLWLIAAGPVISGLAYRISRTGADRFAISYAEDAFGGQMWFFGAAATAAGASLTVTVVLAALLLRAKRR